MLQTDHKLPSREVNDNSLPSLEETRLKALALPNFRLPLHDATPTYTLPRLRTTVGPLGIHTTSASLVSHSAGLHKIHDTSTRKPKDRANQNWDAEEDAKIIELRATGMTWSDVASKLPGRTKIACRLHYQHCLEKKGEWDDQKKTKLAKVYELRKEDIWRPIAVELGVSWRNAEAMHWVMGERGMARRANTTSSPTTPKPDATDQDMCEETQPFPNEVPTTNGNDRDISPDADGTPRTSSKGELADPSTLILRASDSSSAIRIEESYERHRQDPVQTSPNLKPFKRRYYRWGKEASKWTQDCENSEGVDDYVWVTRKRSRDNDGECAD